jgi:hypothetical protein
MRFGLPKPDCPYVEAVTLFGDPNAPASKGPRGVIKE